VISNYLLSLSRQIFVTWNREKLPFDRVVADVFRENKVGSSERAQISDAVYNVVRFWPLVTKIDEVKLENPVWMRIFESHLKGAFSRTRDDWLHIHASAKPEFSKDPEKHLHLVHGIPHFLLSGMNQSLENWHLFLHQMLDEAPTFIRVNSQKISRSDLLAKKRPDFAEAISWSPEGCRLKKRISLANDDSFKSGEFEIHDESSQLIAAVADPQPDECIFDMCAGAGGKSLHLAVLLKNTGEVHSYDVAQRKLGELATRAKRANLKNIHIHDSIPVHQKYDCVLVDAPCSSLGTLRRNPDQLWRLNEKELLRIQTIQKDLLKKAKTLLRPGGRIVYSTCTVRPEENGYAVARLGMRPGNIENSLRKYLGSQFDIFLTAARLSPAHRIHPRIPDFEEAALQWGPSSHTNGVLQGDGFFVARLESEM
jgi:16S rRNA (cytosine967-C5)-methyltransferase